MVSPGHAHPSGVWDNHAQKWSSSVSSITLAPCTTLLQQASSLLSLDASSTHVLDNGAGSGQLTGLIKKKHPNIPVAASDISKGMLETLDQAAHDQGWTNTHTIVQDAQDLKDFSNDSFSHVFCTFVVNFVEDPQKAVNEMYRVLRPGGVLGLGTWSRISWVPIWEQAVHKVHGNTNYKAPDLFHSSTVDVAEVEKAMQAAGFKDVFVEPFKCYHPKRTVRSAVDEFYNMHNPSIKLLMKGFSEDFIGKTRPHFKAEYDRHYEGGNNPQFEIAILAVGKK